MATSSNQVSNSARQPSSSDVISSRLSRPAEPGLTSNGSSQPPRSRPGQPRNSGRTQKGGQNTRDNKPTPDNDVSASTLSGTHGRSGLPEKPTLSIASPSDFSNINTKKKNFSTRPSRANSAVNTSRSSPVTEALASPASSRSSNRRKRSGVGKGNNIPKIHPPTPQDNLLRPGRPRIGVVPLTAPMKDPPPHLSHNLSPTPTGSFDMSKNIDALVERVRAVAMAENRPSTPGSHIDWAGDDDDSLPDLDDWGIPSLVDHKAARVISPIMVGGLKPLPELSPLETEKDDQQASPPSDLPSPEPPNEGGAQRPLVHHLLLPRPPVSSTTDITNEVRKPMEPCHFPPSEGPPFSAAALQPNPDGMKKQFNLPSHHEFNKDELAATPSDTQNQEHLAGQGSPGSGGLTQSIHAPNAEQYTEFEQKGLGASIHAPRAIIDSNSASTHLGGRSPRNRQTHARAHTVGRPFSRPNQNDSDHNCSPRLGRGGLLGSPKRHSRNYSSPSITTANRTSHSRPVLTGDAISRLARAVGSTTTPPTKTTPVAND